MNIRKLLRSRLEAALIGLAPETELAAAAESVMPSQDPKFGDYQINCAMRLGNSLKRPPREVAQEIVSRLKVDDFCAPAEIAGPGFVNLKLRDAGAALSEARGVDLC